MRTHLLPPALMALLEMLLLAHQSSALAVRAMDIRDLLPRDTCSKTDGLASCGQGLPSNFCCSTGTTCIPLYNTAVQSFALCCPTGSDCSVINTITCDTNLLDPVQYPGSALHSSDITQKLPICGTGCCPLGFECVNGQCSVKASALISSSVTQAAQSATSTSTSSSSTQAASSTSTSSSSTTSATPSTLASATTSPNTIEPKQTSNDNKAGLVLAGLFPGLLLGAAIVLAVLFYLKRKREKRGYKPDTASSFFGPPTPFENRPPKISIPIYRPGMSERVVFGQSRTAEGGVANKGVGVGVGGGGEYYKPSENRGTADSATLVSPPPPAKDSNTTSNNNGDKSVPTLGPPFETPTKPGRAATAGRKGQPPKSFFSTSSRASTSSPPSPSMSRRNTQRTTGSMETISMLMGPPRVPSYQRTPEVRQTTYSDVYRAAGISPSQVRSERPSVDTGRN